MSESKKLYTHMYFIYLIKWQRRGLNTILNIIVCDITTEILCTGVIIVHKLDRGITLVKTWYSNPKWFLEEPKVVSGNTFLSTIFYQIDDTNEAVSNKNALLVCSYVTKPKSGKQNQVVILNITYPLKGTMDDNVRRPVLLKLYHFTKGGTDVVDHRLTRNKGCTTFHPLTLTHTLSHSLTLTPNSTP